MLAVNIKYCITNFSTGLPFKFTLLIGKVVFNKKKVEISEIVGLKIFHSGSQVSIIFITYTLLKCLPNETMQLILYMDDGHFIYSVKVWAISFV